MKMRVIVTIEIDDADVKKVVQYAKDTGHDFDKTHRRDVILRRFAQGAVNGAILRAVETTNKEEDVDGR